MVGEGEGGGYPDERQAGGGAEQEGRHGRLRPEALPLLFVRVSTPTPLSSKTQISEVLRLVDFCIGRYNKRSGFLVRRIVVWIFTRG